MKFFKIFIMILLLGAIISYRAYAQPLTGYQIMEKVYNRDDGEDRKTSMTMTLINRRNRKRIRKMTLLSRDYGKDVKSLFCFNKPADVKGMGFLVWGYDNPSKDDDRWLYLPALKRSRRISGSSKNDYFMGSDLTYDDMGSRSVDEDTHKLTGEKNYEGFDCWIVESVPKEKDYMYSKVIRIIRKDALISVKTDYYARNGSLLKIRYKKDIKKHQNIWTSYITEVNNVKDNHKTILAVEKIDYNVGIGNRAFTVSSLEKGRL